MSKTQKAQTSFRSATLKAGTWNEEEQSVEVIWATDSPFKSWQPGIGEFMEVLSFDKGHIRSERLDVGVPVLDDHDKYKGTRGVLGVMDSYKLAANQGTGKLVFSDRDDYTKGVARDVSRNIHRSVSAGYRVRKYVDLNPLRGTDELPLLKAIDWEVTEVSIAPIPIDIGARIRSEKEEEFEFEIITLEEEATGTRSETAPVAENAGTEISTQPEVTNKTMSEEKKTPEATTEVQGNGAEGARSETAHVEKTITVDAEKIRSEAKGEERVRVTEIREAVRSLGLGSEFEDTHIVAGTSSDQVRKLAIDEWKKTDPTKGQNGHVTTITADETDKRRSAMQAALILRANPSFQGLSPQEVEMARSYRGMSLIRMAEENILAHGGNARGLAPREIATAALGIDHQSQRSAGMHSTGDFPIILGNTINRVLRAEYDLAAPTFRPWTRQTTAKDFREMTKAQMGEVGNFEEVFEGGEYKATTLSEAKEAYRIKKFGQMINVTWEALINDDLNAFSTIPMKIANAAARKQSDIVYGILSTNAAMGDGVALFHSTHGNKAASGAAIDITTLSAGRKALRNMKGLDNKDFLNLSPSFLVVGPNYEQIALQYLSNNYLPATEGNINPWKGLMQVIVEPRITGNAWYMIVNPGQVETIEYAFLEGEGELYTETRQGFEVDGVQVKARMTFGAKAIDYRGMYLNAGA